MTDTHSTEARKILFFGTPYFAVPTLKALASLAGLQVSCVITQPDRPSGRGATINPTPIKLAAQELAIKTFQPTSLRREFDNLKLDLDQLGEFDLGVVVAYGQILPSNVLSYPKLGCVNIHGSILPRWRGAAPIQRAIEAGDNETGVCLMQMDSGLDTGAVFSCARVNIRESDTYQSLHDTLAHAGADLLKRDIFKILDGSLRATPQSESGVTYASKINSSECQVNWGSSADEIALKIRAFYPFPGCYTLLPNGKRLKILRVNNVGDGVATATDREIKPGTVIQALSDSVVVKCGLGALRLLEVQPEGRKRQEIADFLRGGGLRNFGDLTVFG
jgi:methionyl-tRNA formyltransferase